MNLSRVPLPHAHVPTLRTPALPSVRHVAAVSHGERRFAALAVIADSPDVCAPCGMCRQMLMEFPIRRILLANTAGAVRVMTPAELLPCAFGAAALPVKEEHDEISHR